MCCVHGVPVRRQTKEVQSKFLVLMEDADRPGQERAAQPAGYRRRSMVDALAHGDKYRENSRLQKQTQAGNAKQNLRLNNDVNTETEKWGGAPWTEDREKLTPPNSHPSNPVHKVAMKSEEKEVPISPTSSSPPEAAPATTSHNINKALIVVGAVLLTGLLVWKS